MQEYYFLFTLCLVYTVFAVVQDLKSREVANWLNFSLIAFALAYRLFFSISTSNYFFFLIGMLGFAIFFILAYALYYGKVFAGGDAKLLMGYGIILPFTTFTSLFTTTLLFLIILFSAGALYSIVYSIFIAINNKQKFQKQFSMIMKKNKFTAVASAVLFFLFLIMGFTQPMLFLVALLTLTPILYFYTKSLDACMLKKYSYTQLTEGDWIENDIKINSKITIKKTVHGLSVKDIYLLKKYKKNILVKEGIPFTPAFLFALIVTVCAWANGALDPNSLLSFLHLS